MVYEVRSYLIDDEGSPRPIARSRRRRLFEGTTAFEEFAGRRVRCAHVVLEGDGPAVRQEAYSLVQLDPEGRVAPDDALRWLHLVIATDGLDRTSGCGRGLAWEDVTRTLPAWRPDPSVRARVLDAARLAPPGAELASAGRGSSLQALVVSAGRSPWQQ